MAAIGLHHHTDVFKSKDIKGSELIHLNRDKLVVREISRIFGFGPVKCFVAILYTHPINILWQHFFFFFKYFRFFFEQNMGIKDEFHRKTILHSVDELCSARPPSTVAADMGLATVEASHRLKPTTFSRLEECTHCQKPLRGLHMQGLSCQDCSTIAHRSCAALNELPQCQSGGRFTRHVSRYAFGKSLCSSFDVSAGEMAPLVLRRLVEELERQASLSRMTDVYRLYQLSTTNEQLEQLRKRLEMNPNTVQLTEYSPQCLVSMIKRFLRDLPDPVIPVQFYDYFVLASRK